MNFYAIRDSLKERSGNFSDYVKTRNPAFYILLGFVFVVTVLTYSSSIGNAFIVNWDDTKFITENYWVRNLSLQTLYDIFFTIIAEHYHPFTHLSNALEFYFFGLHPEPYHLVNLLLHILNSFLVFSLMLRLDKDLIKAFFASLLFALHPMHVESVAWLSERKDLLYGFFFLISLTYYLQYIESKLKLHYFYALMFFVFALLSKSAAVALAPVILLFDVYYKRKPDRKLILEKLPFFLLSLLFGLLAVYSQKLFGALNMAPEFPIYDRIFLVSYSVVFYVFKFFLPVHLSALHPYPQTVNGFLPIIYYLCPLILLSVVFVIYKLRNFRTKLIFGVLLYLIPVSLVLQIIPVGEAIVAERFSYIPYLGLIYIVVMIPDTISEKWKRYYWLILFAVIILFSGISFNRTLVWKDGFTLFEDVSKKYPQSYYAYWSMGTAKYLGGENEVAVSYYKRCIELNPRFDDAYLKIGLIRYREENFKAAIEANELAVFYNPKNSVAYNNLGLAQKEAGDSVSAVKSFSLALEIDSDYFLALRNRADIFFRLKQYDKSVNDYKHLIRLHPGDADMLARLAMAESASGDLKGALADFTASIQINPVFAEIYTMRGEVYDKMNETEKAVVDYSQALYLNKNYGPAYLLRGNANFKMGRNRSACEDWKKALSLHVAEASERLNQNCR
jgi:tetratricopeptide (TPR) repeat protein